MTRPRTRHTVEVPDVDKKVRAKIVDLFLNHDVTRTALCERFGCSIVTINCILRDGGVIARPKEPEGVLDRAFADLVKAAVIGARCPANDKIPGRAKSVSLLAREGRIFVEVYVHNFRRVTILTGEHRGKTTANPPLYAGKPPKPYLTVGLVKRRNGAVIPSVLDARST